MAISIAYRMQLHSASDLDQICLKARNSKDGCTFQPNIFAPFGGTFNAKPIIQIALRKLHVNGATKVKLYSYIRFTLKLYDYIGIGKYLGVSKFFR